MTRFIALAALTALAALALSACALPFPDVNPDAQLACAEDAECPDNERCHPVLNTCFSAVPACASETDLLADGTLCDLAGDDGICVSGACVASACGDGFLDLALNVEVCDDGNADDTDACTNACVPAACGDSIVQAGVEDCDDGNTTSGDGCRADCAKIEVCGDGAIDQGEACDDGNANNDDTCVACQVNICGDGVRNLAAEACDDGNTASGDGCREDCAKVEVCGDALLDEGEACDDGNDNKNDGCDACALVEWAPAVMTGFGPGFGVGPDTALERPTFIASDLGGNAFVAGNGLRDCRVRRIDAAGDIAVVAGNGTCISSGDDGPATSAGIEGPFGLAVDARGRIFMTENRQIRFVDEAGTIRRLAGTGESNFPGDSEGLPALTAAVDPAGGIAVADTGVVFFVDRRIGVLRVRSVGLDGILRTVAGGGENEGTNPSLDGSPALGATLNISGLQSLAVRPDGAICFSEDDAIRCVEASGNLSSAASTVGRQAEGFTFRELGNAPDDWICPSSFFGAGDGCDCGCGVVDADCADGAIGTCSFSGICGGVANVDPAEPTQCVGGSGPAREEVLFVEAVTHSVLSASRGALFRVAGAGTEANPGGPPCDEPFDGDGAAATAAHLACPTGVAVTTTGDIFVADREHDRVRRVRGGIIETVLGNGKRRDAIDGVAATGVLISDGGQVALDPQGRPVFVDSAGGRVIRLNDDGTVTNLAGIGGFGVPVNGDVATEVRLGFPSDVAFDGSGRLLILENSNRRVLRVEVDGTLTIIAGGAATDGGDGGLATDAQFVLPNGLAVAPDGSMFIADMFGDVVRKVDPAGIISTVAGGGASPQDGVAATASSLNGPRDVAVKDGELFIADSGNNAVRVVNAQGIINTYAGTLGNFGDDGDKGQATAARLSFPISIAFDGEVLFIADESAARVRSVSAAGVIDTEAGTGTSFVDSRDGGLALLADLDRPGGVVVDPQGRLLIATDGRLRRVEAEVITTLIGAVDPVVGDITVTRLSNPVQVLALAPDNVLMLDVGRVLRASLATSRVEVILGYPDGFELGADPAGGDNRARFVRLVEGAAGLAFDGASTLYLAERDRGQVWAIDAPSLTDPSTWTSRVFSDDPALVSPASVAYDPVDDAVLVVDADAHVLRSIDVNTGAVRTRLGVENAPGIFDGFLNQPSAVTVGLDGAVFVADAGNHRVLRLDGNVVSRVLGTGEASSSGDGAPAADFPVDTPAGLGVDTYGNLLVTSTRAVRLVTANQSQAVRPEGAVITLYGATPRDTFPESATFCLSGTAERADGSILVTDRCAGYLIELTRVNP